MKHNLLLVVLLLTLLNVSTIEGTVVYGWGRNDYGQLGLGTYDDPVFNVTAIPFYAFISVTRISLGQYSHFAATGTSTYSCGSNSQGQLGQGAAFTSTASPGLVAGLTGDYSIFSLPVATIAYSSAQKTILGWGFAAGYVRGFSSGYYYKAQPILPDYGLAGNIVNVSTANGCNFVFLANGTIFTSGVSSNGVFGMGDNSSIPAYEQMSFWPYQGINVLNIFTTQASTVFAQSDNRSIFGWGSNAAGQLGIGNLRNDVFTPTLLSFFDITGLLVAQIKQGIMHTLALTCGGRVFAWGANQRGQLAIGTSDLDFHTVPAEVVFPQNATIVEIVAGSYHNFARTVNNDWFFWGAGDTGVSGLGLTTNDILLPLKIDKLKSLSINHIESGSYSQFAMGWNMPGVATSPPNCPDGWNVNECTIPGRYPCGPNTDCFDTDRAFICECKQGYQLNDSVCEDIDECLENPCVPEASCNNTDGSFFCECPTGFVGDGLPGRNGCVPIVCGNGIKEPGEECDVLLTPSCCNASCFLLPSAYVCRNSTVPCDKTEYCDGTSEYCPPDDWSSKDYCAYCGNSICDASESCSTCPDDCDTCDACTEILCNGKCVGSPLDCIVVCPSTQFACASGDCVSDFTLCTAQNCSSDGIVCWDGSCTTDLSLCPLIPACPLLTKRCYGKCIQLDQDCDVSVNRSCTTGQQTCLDGQCSSKCAQYNGCGTGLIRCPSGDCTDNITVCKGPCTGDQYLCGDGTCNLPDNCTVLLRFETAIPFTKHVSATENSDVNVISQSGLPVVRLKVLGGTFKDPTAISVNPASFSTLKTVRSPKAWGNNSKLEDNIFSSSVTFDVPDGTWFYQNMTLAFNISTLPHRVNSTVLCLGFVNSNNEWECASDNIVCDSTSCKGETPHFTSFAIISSVHPPQFNSLPNNLDAFLNFSNNSVIVYVFCGLVIVFSVLYAWAFHADKEQKSKKQADSVHKTEEFEYQEEIRKPTPRMKSTTPSQLDTSTVSTMLAASTHSRRYANSNASLLAPSPVLVINRPSHRPTSSSSSAVDPTASASIPPTPSSASIPSSSPSASPALSPFTSPISIPFADGELAVSQPNEGNESSRRARRKTIVMKEAAQTRFATKHKWLSIYFTARIENLPRKARVTILLCMILTNMTIAAALFNAANRKTFAQRLVVGIISSMIAFVCSFAIFSMFKFTNKKYRPICYIVSTIYILGTGFLTLWYNLEAEQNKAYGWCVSSAIGIIQDALVNEPLKIVLISFLIAFCPFLPYVHKL